MVESTTLSSSSPKALMQLHSSLTIRWRREKALFQNTPQNPNRTLLFVVPDRKQSTLRSIIERYVAPGTMVFSDQWRAYIDLNGRFTHFTVAHNKRFDKYVFKPRRGVIKVTTNHFESLGGGPKETERNSKGNCSIQNPRNHLQKSETEK